MHILFNVQSLNQLRENVRKKNLELASLETSDRDTQSHIRSIFKCDTD